MMFDQPPGSAYINPLDLDILKSAMLSQGHCVCALYARGREKERTENGSFCLLLRPEFFLLGGGGDGKK